MAASVAPSSLPCPSKRPAESADDSLISKVRTFVEAELAGNDASHDWSHIARVWALARRLAADEGLGADDLELVELAALLHDIDDWKYSGSETAGVEAARAFLEKEGVAAGKIDRVCFVIQRVSFHDEIGRSDEERQAMRQDKALACVQDADRLDAIGAIGIARTFTFGGKKMRPLYSKEEMANGPAALAAMTAADAAGRGGGSATATAAAASSSSSSSSPSSAAPKMATKEEYGKKGKDSSTTYHFHEKLFHLRGMMKTESGKRVAQERHDFMASFLDRFYKECQGEM
eukprot:g3083.t1